MPPDQELARQHGVTATFFSSGHSYRTLDYGKKLVKEGKIKPNFLETMKLSEAAKAQEMVSAGGIDGKVVLETA